jgi:hypothetical protein
MTAHLRGYVALLCLLLGCRTAQQSERAESNRVRTTPAALTAKADSVAVTAPAPARGFVPQPDSRPRRLRPQSRQRITELMTPGKQ